MVNCDIKTFGVWSINIKGISEINPIINAKLVKKRGSISFLISFLAYIAEIDPAINEIKIKIFPLK